jgi:transcriptional regulator with XRE-family HTH domain
MATKSFKDLFEKDKKGDQYWIQKVVLEFTEEIYFLMGKKEMSQADLARTLGYSPPYVNKILKGGTNFTIESMVKIVRALGAELNVHFSSDGDSVRWFDVLENRKRRGDNVCSDKSVHIPEINQDTLGYSDDYPAAA